MRDQYEERRRSNGTAAAAGKGDPTLGRAHAGRTRQQPAREWWHPTRRSRAVGVVLVGFLLIVVLAVAGAIEDPAHGSEPSPLDREVALWDGLSPLDRAYYCAMPRRDAVLVWAAGMDEGEGGIAARNIRVAKRVLSRGCPS